MDASQAESTLVSSYHCCLFTSHSSLALQDLSASKVESDEDLNLRIDREGEDLDVMGDEPQPTIQSEHHELMTELSDVPPAQLLEGGLLDAGSEDMEMVRCHGNGMSGCGMCYYHAE